MDLQFWWMLLKIVVFLPFVLLLIYASVKYGGTKLQDFQNGKYVKVLERTSISKENSILVVKIGEKGFVMASTNERIEILSELSKEEISNVESLRAIPQYESINDFYVKTGLKNFHEKFSKDFYKKLKIKKEDKSNE